MQRHTPSSMALQIMSDHLQTLSGAGQKLIPSESTLIWIPRMTNSRPCSSLRLEIADCPRQARTKRAKHSLATSTHSALSPVTCKMMYANNPNPSAAVQAHKYLRRNRPHNGGVQCAASACPARAADSLRKIHARHETTECLSTTPYQCGAMHAPMLPRQTAFPNV